MMTHQGIHFQLIDLPAVSPEHPIPWLANALQTADACLFVVALSDPACLEEVEAAHAVLQERRVSLSEVWPFGPGTMTTAAPGDEDPFALRLPTLLLANKADRLGDPAAELRAFLELSSLRYPALAVSPSPARGWARSGRGSSITSASCASTRRRRPSTRPDPSVRPATGTDRRGVARLVHKDLARTLRHARVRGHAGSRASSWVASIG